MFMLSISLYTMFDILFWGARSNEDGIRARLNSKPPTPNKLIDKQSKCLMGESVRGSRFFGLIIIIVDVARARVHFFIRVVVCFVGSHAFFYFC